MTGVQTCALPIYMELGMIYENQDAINDFIFKYIAGGTTINGDAYWSSTECDGGRSLDIVMLNGSSFAEHRAAFKYVRAVAVVE